MVATQLNILKKSITFCAEPNFLQYTKMAKHFRILSSLSSGKMERYRNKQLGSHSHTIPASTLFSQITTQLWTANQHSRLSVHNMADIGSRSKYSLILQIVWQNQCYEINSTHAQVWCPIVVDHVWVKGVQSTLNCCQKKL